MAQGSVALQGKEEVMAAVAAADLAWEEAFGEGASCVWKGR